MSMQNLSLVFLMLISSSALAITPCADFPQFTAGGGPRQGVTGLPLTYNFRLSCLPDGGAFSLGELQASYRLAENEIKPVGALIVSPLPGEEYLYQALFLIPQEQTPGLYVIDGCQMVTNRATGETRCIAIASSRLDLATRQLTAPDGQQATLGLGADGL